MIAAVNERREKFLKGLKQSDSIYGDLITLEVPEELPDINVVNIQYYLKSNIDKKQRLKTFIPPRYPEFLVIENRESTGDMMFHKQLIDSTKIYVALDLSKIYEIVSQVLAYMEENNIKFQAKLSKNIRSDMFVIRAVDKEKVEGLIKYINSLNYKPTIFPNPFALQMGKVSVTKDGYKSYNKIFSSQLEQYLKATTNPSLEGLRTHIIISKDAPDISKNNKMILDIITRNLDNNLTLEELQSYKIHEEKPKTTITKEDIKNVVYLVNRLHIIYNINEISQIIQKYINTGDISYFTRKNEIRQLVVDTLPPETLEKTLVEISKGISMQNPSINNIIYEIITNANVADVLNESDYIPSIKDEEQVIKIISDLNEAANLNIAHRSIQGYINTGDEMYFPDKKVMPANKMRIVVDQMIWDNLINASIETYFKYGKTQLENAIKLALTKGDISGFTNENNARSRLGFISNPDLLKQAAIQKYQELVGDEITLHNLINVIADVSMNKIENSNRKNKTH